MGKKDFDNLLKVIQSGVLLNSTGIVSVELDFELPRGFIAKLFDIFIQWVNWQEDFEGLGATEVNVGVDCVLLRDPDDTTTIAIPENSVQHDAIFQTNFQFFQQATTAVGQIIGETVKELQIPEHIDVITARNMRFNIQGKGPDAASLTESSVRIEVYYTLEEVTDADILNLLDIL